MRLLMMLVFIEVIIMVPVWCVVRVCRGQACPIWDFLTGEKL